MKSPVDVSAMTADHLSPVLARALFVDPIQAVVPWQFTALDRAAVLEESFYAEIQGKKGRELFRGLTPRRLESEGDAARPHVRRDGRADGTADRPFGRKGVRRIGSEIFPRQRRSAGYFARQAAVSSARFPWVTPTVRLKTGEGRYSVLADGGCAENTGARTIVDLANDLKEYAALSQKKRRTMPSYRPTKTESAPGCTSPSCSQSTRSRAARRHGRRKLSRRPTTSTNL
jgi:hypothetical protein